MTAETKTPADVAGAGLSPEALDLCRRRDAWLSDLRVNAETMDTLVRGITAELDELHAAGQIPRLSVDDKLRLVLEELQREAGNLIRITPVAARRASDLLAVETSICPLAYRRAAEAAKDRARGAVNVDGELHQDFSNFTGELPKDQWRVDVAGSVAYISTTGRDGFRDYFAADLVPRDPKDQVALDRLEGAFVYAVDGTPTAANGEKLHQAEKETG